MWCKAIGYGGSRRGASGAPDPSFSYRSGPAALVAAWLLAVAGSAAAADYDPLGKALANAGIIENPEAPVVPQCYTKTGGIPNPCWTCHTASQGTNFRNDAYFQEQYDFSDIGWVNHWGNLFVDRSLETAVISDEEILQHIRGDNYILLQETLAQLPAYAGYVPDLDLSQGWGADGFARDGSGWRAVRYKPFIGTYWPTNGSIADVFVRLPVSFRQDASGNPSTAHYRANLSILEVAMTGDPRVSDADLVRESEPIDETAAGIDLDGDGRIAGAVSVIRGLPARYVGGAADVAVTRYLYPLGTEFLSSVRYVDPDHPALLSTRFKELRYARKVLFLDTWALSRAYEDEQNDKDSGWLPIYTGSALVGLRNDFGWQLQGFIEDEEGRLRVQTDEEHYYCMGCHSTIGVTVDQTFAFPRKVPGADGWQTQFLPGIPDVPQVGHADPEFLTYFRRARGGDAFRANGEILARFFPLGVLDEEAVLRAAPGGDKDIAYLLTPSRERALSLGKAYLTIVREQSFERGRDAFVAPPTNVYDSVCEWCHATNASTGLLEQGRTYADGALWLDWSDVSAPAPVASPSSLAE